MIAAEADTIPPPSLPKTLGERCVLWSLTEMQREPVPGRATLSQYFAACERGKKNIGAWLADEVIKGKKYNHCAAAVSEALRICRADFDVLPHAHRAGAREIMTDAIDRHCWHDVSEVSTELWTPNVGDVAVYDRSTPGRPETAGLGHVDRVTRLASENGVPGYWNIGANEGPGGAWRLQWSAFKAPRLLGFVAYPGTEFPPVEPAHLLTDEEIAHVRALADQMSHDAEPQWWADIEAEKRRGMT
jgi:hypothetical protein